MMEFINCKTLFESLFYNMNTTKTRIKINELKFICAELIIGLNFLHDNGIVHR